MRTARYKKMMIVVLSVLIVSSPLLAGQRGTGRGARRGPGLAPGAPGGREVGPLGAPAEFGRGLVRRGGPNRGEVLAAVLRRVELTEEQRERIKGILDAAAEGSESSRVAVGDATKALRAAVVEGADEAAIRDAAADLGKALGDQAVLRAATMASVKEVLTEEQLEQLQKMKEPQTRERFGRAAAWQRGFRAGRRLGERGRSAGRQGIGPRHSGSRPGYED